MKLSKIKEKFIIIQNDIFKNHAVITNVEGKWNQQLSLLLQEECQSQEEAVKARVNQNPNRGILGQKFLLVYSSMLHLLYHGRCH